MHYRKYCSAFAKDISLIAVTFHIFSTFIILVDDNLIWLFLIPICYLFLSFYPTSRSVIIKHLIMQSALLISVFLVCWCPIICLVISFCFRHVYCFWWQQQHHCFLIKDYRFSVKTAFHLLITCGTVIKQIETWLKRLSNKIRS